MFKQACYHARRGYNIRIVKPHRLQQIVAAAAECFKAKLGPAHARGRTVKLKQKLHAHVRPVRGYSVHYGLRGKPSRKVHFLPCVFHARFVFRAGKQPVFHQSGAVRNGFVHNICIEELRRKGNVQYCPFKRNVNNFRAGGDNLAYVAAQRRRAFHKRAYHGALLALTCVNGYCCRYADEIRFISKPVIKLCAHVLCNARFGVYIGQILMHAVLFYHAAGAAAKREQQHKRRREQRREPQCVFAVLHAFTPPRPQAADAP